MIETQEAVLEENESAISELTETVEESPIPEENTENSTEANEESNDDYYRNLIESDLNELRRLFPEARGINDITELENPLRYARLRDLGLSCQEAYLATSPKRRRVDTRAHLSSVVSHMASAPNGRMSRAELERARELFDGMSDSEIQNLYKKVTK